MRPLFITVAPVALAVAFTVALAGGARADAAAGKKTK